MELDDKLDFSGLYSKDSFFFKPVTIKEFILNMIEICFWRVDELGMMLGIDRDFDVILTKEKRHQIIELLKRELET